MALEQLGAPFSIPTSGADFSVLNDKINESSARIESQNRVAPPGTPGDIPSSTNENLMQGGSGHNLLNSNTFRREFHHLSGLQLQERRLLLDLFNLGHADALYI